MATYKALEMQSDRIFAVSKDVRESLVDEFITTMDDRQPTPEPFYYDRELFEGWDYSVRGWAPAKDADRQRQPSNSTEVNLFHIEVNNHPWKASIMDGPQTQHVRLWKNERRWDQADERVTIDAPVAPYLVFIAVLRKPENFL